MLGLDQEGPSREDPNHPPVLHLRIIVVDPHSQSLITRLDVSIPNRHADPQPVIAFLGRPYQGSRRRRVSDGAMRQAKGRLTIKAYDPSDDQFHSRRRALLHSCLCPSQMPKEGMAPKQNGRTNKPRIACLLAPHRAMPLSLGLPPLKPLIIAVSAIAYSALPVLHQWRVSVRRQRVRIHPSNPNAPLLVK